MFRAAQANPFDDAVGRATDENLTSVNWEHIMNVCDRVGELDSGAKDAVASIIKRLAHRNANVQLYTLELANALSQNCGLNIHKELASRSFTEALIRLANDRNTHQQVKSQIIERMGDWTEMFARNPDLGIMDQAYSRLKSQNPSLHPPSKPFKREITDVDRQKEEDELQMALALSIKDKQPQNPNSSIRDDSSATQSSVQYVQPTQSLPTGTTAATISRVRAMFDFQPSEPGELQFRKGDIIAVLESVYKDWWKGSLRGQTGIFPLNYVEKLQDPTQEEMQREAQMEAEVFAEIKNVEKLLALLSTSGSDPNAKDNEEITTLYHSTLSIRPKLIELIGKYSQKKDDFTQLNEKFIKARRDYESLLEASMSPPYGARPPQQNAYSYGVQLPVEAFPPPSQPQAQHTDPQQYYPPEHHYPSQNGPAPFYMIAPGQQQQQLQQSQQQAQPPRQPQSQQQPPPPPQQQLQAAQQQQAQQQYPASDPLQPAPLNLDPRNRTQKPMAAGMYVHPTPPTSQYNNPQELATSSYDPPLSTYDTPTDGREMQGAPPAVDSYAYQPPGLPTSQDAQYNSPRAQINPPQPTHQAPGVPAGAVWQTNQGQPYSSLGAAEAPLPNYAQPRAGTRPSPETDASDYYR